MKYGREKLKVRCETGKAIYNIHGRDTRIEN